MTLKNIKSENARQWWNTWIGDQEIHNHSWQTSARNEQMSIRNPLTRMDDQRKNHTDTKRSSKRNCHKQLQTHNVHTYDVANTNGTNKGRDLLLTSMSRIVPWGTEMMPQRNQRRRRATIHWSKYPQQEQDETQKSSYGLDWLRKGVCYGHTKLNHGNHENLESGIEIWPYEQMLYAQFRISPGKLDIQTPQGFWHSNKSPNLGQTTRNHHNQQ